MIVLFIQIRYVNEIKPDMLMSCCTKILTVIPKVGTCTDSVLALKYSAPDGDYTFQIDFLNAAINKAVTVAGDGIAQFSTSDLNEGFTYVGKLFDADGVLVPLVWNDISYDCIQFTTAQIIGTPINFVNDAFPYSMPI